MPYVMVPVPEEHVEEVMRLIIRANERANLVDWDDDSLSSFYEEIDEVSRSLLAFVARAVASGTDLTEGDAAKTIELTTRETVGILRELNEMARDREHPPVLVVRKTTEVLPNGRTQEKRVLSMEPELAAMVQRAEQAERADLLGDIEPLTDQPGT